MNLLRLTTNRTLWTILIVFVYMQLTASKLTFVESVTDGVRGALNVDDPEGMVISPDDQFLYAATEDDNGVLVFSINNETCELTFVESIIDNSRLFLSSKITISHDGNYIYVTALVGTITVFSRDTNTGRLTFVQDFFDNTSNINFLDRAEFVEITPDDRFLYVTSANEDAINIFQRNIQTGELTFVDVIIDNTGNITGLESPRQFRISPDGQNLYVTSRQDNALSVFSINQNSGALTIVEEITFDSLHFLISPTFIDISPDGNFLYLVDFDDIIIYRRSPSDGSLDFVDQIRYSIPEFPFIGEPQAIITLQNYVIVNGSRNLIPTIYQRNTTTGEIELLEDTLEPVIPEFPSQPEGLAITDDKKCIYVASGTFDMIDVFMFEPTPDDKAEVIPTLSEWSLIILFLLFLIIGSVGIKQEVLVSVHS